MSEIRFRYLKYMDPTLADISSMIAIFSPLIRRGSLNSGSARVMSPCLDALGDGKMNAS